MSHSGIPVIKDIGQWGAHMGDVFSKELFGDPGQGASPTAAPAPVTGADPRVTSAAQNQDRQMGRGQGANFLTGSGGRGLTEDETLPTVSRSVLLGA